MQNANNWLLKCWLTSAKGAKADIEELKVDPNCYANERTSRISDLKIICDKKNLHFDRLKIAKSFAFFVLWKIML